MKPTLPLLLALLFAFANANAQTNLRAWYADGQVWVVWEVALPLPETFGIYVHPEPFTNTAEATLIGRPFHLEVLGAALKDLMGPPTTYRIPDGMGGTYQLALNEALFVATPHQSGAQYIAVAEWGETTVTAGINLTDEAVDFTFDPDNDPVECHMQTEFAPPDAPGYTSQLYCLWADGRQNHWDGRPDFPVMANAAKNGMPSLFVLSYRDDIDLSQPVPLTVWVHGGGGNAMQSIPGRRPIVNIDPVEGLLLAHQDDLIGWRDTVPPNLGGVSWHFGWRKNWNPFSSGNFPIGIDTVINYTQRRYLWIDEWITENFNVDTNRININGHSMGGAGTTAMVKAHPRHYASATIFNNGFGGPVNLGAAVTFGLTGDNFPTNLTRGDGETVGFAELWNLIDRCSPERDWPLIRCYHSKNDDNEAMTWDAYVVENYRAADSLGMGVQLFWSERAHGIDSGPDYDDHWHNGDLPDQQTGYDDVAYEEANFGKDDWLPAFANHRLQADADDIGDGSIGTGVSGDDWGTWGGYHRWEDVTVTQGIFSWFYSGIFWLEDSTVFENDVCPVDNLTSDMYIRNLPLGNEYPCDEIGGPTIGGYFFQMESLDDNFSYGGNIECEGLELMKLPNITIYRKGIRRLELTVTVIVPTTSTGPTPFTATLHPNPVQTTANLTIDLQAPNRLYISVSSVNGQVRRQAFEGQAGENLVPLDVDGLPPGLYFMEIMNEQGGRAVLKLVKS